MTKRLRGSKLNKSELAPRVCCCLCYYFLKVPPPRGRSPDQRPGEAEELCGNLLCWLFYAELEELPILSCWKRVSRGCQRSILFDIEREKKRRISAVDTWKQRQAAIEKDFQFSNAICFHRLRWFRSCWQRRAYFVNGSHTLWYFPISKWDCFQKAIWSAPYFFPSSIFRSKSWSDLSFDFFNSLATVRTPLVPPSNAEPFLVEARLPKLPFVHE